MLAFKTFYALKSKFYLKKAEEKVKKYINGIKERIEVVKDSEVVVIRLDNLPENCPLSFVFDLVTFVGGKWEDI